MKRWWFIGETSLRTRWSALIIALIGSILVLLDDTTRLPDLSYDWTSVLLRNQQINEVVVVYVDDASLIELGQGINHNARRGDIARLIERCTAAQAKAVFLDFVYDQPDIGDEALVAAIRANGKVILGGNYGRNISAGLIEKRVLPPVEPLLSAACSWGHLDIGDKDRTQGEFPLALAGQMPAFLRVAEAVSPESVARFKEGKGMRWMRHYGHADEVFDSRVLYRALNSKETSDEFFRNKIVMVGRSGGGARVKDEFPDEFKTPWSRKDGTVPGVVIHATCVMNVLRGKWLTQLSLLTELMLVVLIGTGAALLGSALSPRWHWHKFAAFWSAVWVALMFASPVLSGIVGVWWNWLVLLIQIPVAALLTFWISYHRLGPKLVFISYSSKDGAPYARSLQQALRVRYVNAWLDKDDLPVGDYRAKIIRRIPETLNYLLVLTPGVIERAGDPRRMLREEIDCAGLTVPVTEKLQVRGPDPKKPKVIIVSVNQLSRLNDTSGAKASETDKNVVDWEKDKPSRLVVQLADVLDKSNTARRSKPSLRTENTISFDHARFGTMMREIGHGLIGLTDRQTRAFRDLSYLAPEDRDDSEASPPQ